MFKRHYQMGDDTIEQVMAQYTRELKRSKGDKRKTMVAHAVLGEALMVKRQYHNAATNIG
jgi:hypothetical protein